MKYDIYYILEKWAPNLAKNEIYQKLIREIIPIDQSYQVNDICSADYLIELSPEDYGKTIRVDNVGVVDSKEVLDEMPKKIEYSCCLSDENNRRYYKACSAISEGKNKDLVYSYIESYNLKKCEYFSTTTVIISKTITNEYLLKSIQLERCIYDAKTIISSNELANCLHILSNVNNCTDYTKELRKIIEDERKRQFTIPDLQLSIDMEIDSDNNDFYQVLYDGHNCFPTIQTHDMIVQFPTLSFDISLDNIGECINSINLFQDGKLDEVWEKKAHDFVSQNISDNLLILKIDMIPSYSIDKFIEKTLCTEKFVKEKK